MPRLSLAKLIIPAFILGGCAYTPLGAWVSLRSIDPLQADGAALRVAVVAPQDVGLARRPQLVLATLVEGRPRDETRLDLSAATPGPEAPELSRSEGSKTTLFRLEPSQSTRLTEFQDSIRRLKAADIHGRIEVTADIVPCRTEPGEAGTLDVFIKPSSEANYIRVLRKLPIRDLRAAVQADQVWANCPAAPPGL